MRLDRRLVAAHVGSRKEVAALIRGGRVEVDGETVNRPETHVGEAAAVRVDGELIEAAPLALVYHKPEGVLVTMEDPWGRATVASVLGARLSKSLHPVGRLDEDSSGLLLFSSDGQLTQRLLHPKRGVEKEYVACVEGCIAPGLAGVLGAGVATAEGVHTARLLDVEGQSVRLVVTEGKHRMVRRMLANVGLPVVSLRRVRFGSIELGGLASGALRGLTPEEATWLNGIRGG